MIYTDRQRAYTLEWIEQFERSIAEVKRSPGPGDAYEPEMRDILVRSRESMIEDLQGQIAEYDELRSGTIRRLEVESFDQLGKGLVKARIAAGLTDVQLAERLGVEVKAIEDFERFDYEQAPLVRLMQIARAIGAEICAEIRLPEADRSKKPRTRKRSATLAAD